MGYVAVLNGWKSISSLQLVVGNLIYHVSVGIFTCSNSMIEAAD